MLAGWEINTVLISDQLFRKNGGGGIENCEGPETEMLLYDDIQEPLS